MNRLSLNKLAAAVAPLSLTLSAPALAEDASAERVDLPTVTVTADFRQTDVQQIPEATTVVTGAEIEARIINHQTHRWVHRVDELATLTDTTDLKVTATGSTGGEIHVRGKTQH